MCENILVMSIAYVVLERPHMVYAFTVTFVKRVYLVEGIIDSAKIGINIILKHPSFKPC